MANKIAILGGSAMPELSGFKVIEEKCVQTPFGETAAPLLRGIYNGHEIYFLDRHGVDRVIPPHKINYRANIWALHQEQVDKVIGISVVGGIRVDMTPGHFAFPDQLIDYTYGRINSFYEDDFDTSKHIDFSHPYCPLLHELLVRSARELNLDFTDDATYAATQGPRFETVAEINRLERDGCDIVGMTAMPEAALARELDISYGCIAVVGAQAAGRSRGVCVNIEEIKTVVKDNMDRVYELLTVLFDKL